jgi:hypothetical protein
MSIHSQETLERVLLAPVQKMLLALEIVVELPNSDAEPACDLAHSSTMKAEFPKNR